MNDAKEEIKARLAVEDVVGQYIELRRAGRTLKGRSPWGVDKTPSFMVSPEKGIWHDFSANKGGDIFSFVMEVEGISFREAMEKLAAQAGVDLSKYSSGDLQMTKRKARAREALELACKYYQFCLSKNRPVCEYVFYKRNLNRGTVNEFRIGYSPKEGKVLKDFLTKRGFTKQEMEDAGLLNRFDGDMFRARMMVPFIDTTGNVIGFTARILDKGEPKYLNTPETILFNKGRFIFGLAQAKEAIRKNGFVVIVEGNMDVISSHQAGVKEAVATSGTAMTEMHLKALSRLTNDIRLAYDGDAAGVNATERAIKMAGELGIKLSVISDYGGAKDPDELIQKGPELWQKAVEKRVPAVDWLIKKYEENLDLTTADGKQEFSDSCVKLFESLPKVQQKHYKQLVAKKLDVEVEDLGNVKEKTTKRLKPVKAGKNAGKLKMLEDSMFAIALNSDVKLKKDLELPSDQTKKDELALVFSEKYADFDGAALEKEMVDLTTEYEKEINQQEIKMWQEKLMNAKDEDEELEILRKIKTLQRN